MGYDDAAYIRLREQLVDAIRQLEPHLVVHVLRADVRDLLALEVRQLLRVWHRVEQLLDTDLPARVAGLHVARRGTRDRPARRQHNDRRQIVVMSIARVAALLSKCPRW